MDEIARALILPGAVSLGLLIAQQIKKINFEKRKNLMPDVITRVHAIHKLLHHMAQDLDADRGLILHIKNGGDPPKIDGKVTTTIQYEALRNEKLEFIREDYQDVLIDDGYYSLVADVIRFGKWYGEPSKLERGFLKDLYLSEGVVYCYVFEIMRVPGRYVYGSFRWCDNSHIPSLDTIDRIIRTHEPKLRVLLQE